MTFSQYYDYYLSLHQNKWNRFLHVVGQLCTVLYVAWAVKNAEWLALLMTPLIIYPFAWAGHLFFEKNRPAAWNRPLWAKACDWLMLRDILFRRLS